MNPTQPPLPDPNRSRALQDDLRALLERGWYTNNGPLLKRLEAEVAAWVGAEWAVGVTTAEAAVWLVDAVQAVEGPAWVGPGVPSSWADAFAWRRRARTADLENAAVRIWSATDPTRPTPANRALVEAVDITPIVNDRDHCGRLLDRADALILSLGAGSPLDAGEGGLICGRDPLLRDRLRTARNHHTSEVFAAVPVHFNFKMSEAQAMLALRGLDRTRNEESK